MTAVYELLRERLDHLAIGFPASETGVELRLLERLFSREDAALFLAMGDGFESPVEVAGRLCLDAAKVAGHMEDMAKRGLLFRLRQGDQATYRTLPFVIGIVDFQVNRFDEGLAKDVSEYFGTALKKAGVTKPIPLTRLLPVNKRVVAGGEVLPCDDAISVVRSKDRVSLAPCLCRQTGEARGAPCSHPMETCLQFDTFADFYVENGMARYITKEEAIELLERNEKRGLVIETTNSGAYELMCSCCSCHCSMLMLLRITSGPARDLISNYICRRDETLCTNCGTCVKRCPSRARVLVDGRVQFFPDRCLSCGLCVSTCEAGACVLERKPEGALYTPPATLFDTYDLMAGKGP